jgi:predicted acylesterase/phospholipase RssA
VGVVERLREARIPIDRIGGCSIGAFVAMMFALGWPAEKMETLCRAELLRRRGFADFRLPRVAILKARRAGEMLERVFQSTLMEALPLDAFTVSADLVTGELVVHRQGFVRDAVAASMAVPGLVAPVIQGGRSLVDGGVLDNLPVDVMAEDEEGPIIAVDVMRRPGADPHHLPGVVETISRAMVLGGWQRVERNRELADVVIAPEVERIGFLDFDRLDEAVAAGRRSVDAVLPTLQAMVAS